MENMQLFQGDCIELMKNIPDKSIDLIVTDPPFKFKNQGGGFNPKNNSTKRTYYDSLKKLNCCEFEPIKFLDAVKPKMKKFYGYFFCNKTLIVQYLNWAIQNKFNYDVLVMAKRNPLPAYNNHHLNDLEYIILIREKGTYFSKHKDIDDYRKFFLTICRKGIHPAEKETALIERFLKVSSKENDTVLDPFFGSGTTAVACMNTGRKFIGMELETKYFDIAKQRIENAAFSFAQMEKG